MGGKPDLLGSKQLSAAGRQRADVRMIQRRRRARLTEETLGCGGIAGHGRRQELQRQCAPKPQDLRRDTPPPPISWVIR
jgi:hypothetical protein